MDVRKDQIYRGYKIFNKKRLAVAVSHLVDYPLEFNDKMKLKLIIKEIAQSQRVIIVASPTITPINYIHHHHPPFRQKYLTDDMFPESVYS